jgi:spermidine/putrescine transport system permease protein
VRRAIRAPRKLPVSVSSRRLKAYGLTAPAYIWLLVTVFLPLSVMFFFSFLTKAPFGTAKVSLTLAQYTRFLQRDYYLFLTQRSLVLGIVVTAVCVALGYPLALILAKRIRGRWREALLLLVILPNLSNALVRTFSWTMVLRDGGIVDRGIRSVAPGLPDFDLLYSYPAIVIGLVHSYLPYLVLTSYISLQAIDDDLIEAARSLGATAWGAFRRVVLPLSLPGLAAGIILVFVPVVGAFMEPRILGGQTGMMLGTVIEEQFTEAFNWPLGAALSFILLVIELAVLGLFYPLLRKRLDNVETT